VAGGDEKDALLTEKDALRRELAAIGGGMEVGTAMSDAHGATWRKCDASLAPHYI